MAVKVLTGIPTVLRSLPSRPRPLVSSVAVTVIPCRTLFGFGRRKEKRPAGPMAPEQHPVYQEYLKKKPPPPPTIVRGDLADSSIFASEDAAPEPGKAAMPTVGEQKRDPVTMAAVLDPQPEQRRRWDRKMLIRDIRRRGRLSRTQKLKRTERESLAKSQFIKTSVKKLGALARQIAGKPVEEAIVQMRFSKKKAAKDIREHLEHARNEAIVRRGMGLGEANGTKGDPVEIETKDGRRRKVEDRTGMYVDQAWVGRGSYSPEIEWRARGRANVLRHPKTSKFRGAFFFDDGLTLFTPIRHIRASQGGGHPYSTARGARTKAAQSESLGGFAQSTYSNAASLLCLVMPGLYIVYYAYGSLFPIYQFQIQKSSHRSKPPVKLSSYALDIFTTI